MQEPPAKGVNTALQGIHATLATSIRHKAREALALTLDQADISLQDIANPDDFVYGQLMGYVIIHSQDVKITFKVHYHQELVEKMASPRLGLAEGELTARLCDDYMREYCNLAGGYIADWLTRHEIPAVISIPLVTDGFDELWFSDAWPTGEGRDFWQLSGAHGSLVCSASYLVRDPQALGRLRAPTALSPAAPLRAKTGVKFL